MNGLTVHKKHNLTFFYDYKNFLCSILQNFLFNCPKNTVFVSILFSLVLVHNLVVCETIWAFEVNTHRQLTEKAIEKVESTLNSYLIDNLDLEGGLNASLPGGTPRELMIKGSDFEDNGFRSANHFHDPISNDGWEGNESSIAWGLRPIKTQAGDESWSWNDAREYYFKALTLPTKIEREEQWGKLFRALGQFMHLLQDQASPAHVRNDPHISFGGIGDIDGLHEFMESRNVATYIGLGIIDPDSSILEEAHQTQTVPVANLFDYNQYTGSNPEVTLGGRAGLAEFANANFFSDDRIQGQSISSFSFRSYLYPSLAELIPAPTPSPYLTLPRLGSAMFPGARVAKYTGNQALAKFTLAHLQYDLLGQLQLDDAVYAAYSSHLIPRAVGYSAAVLNYFFRGLISNQPSVFEVCSDHEGRFQPVGTLVTDVALPSNLSFEGTVYFYYDLPDGRVLVSEGSLTSTDIELGGFLSIPLDQLPFFEPIQWTIVLEGEMGPGAKEPRAVVGLTKKASWVDPGCPQ